MKYWFLVLVLVMTGCRSQLAPGWRIDGTRVLGARIEVQGSPDEATLRSGAPASATFLIASPPDDRPMLSWAFVSCIGAPVRTGNPVCGGPPLGELQRGTGTPRAFFDGNTTRTGAASGSLLLLGAICDGADPILENGIPGCGPGARDKTLLTLQIPAAGDTLNRNPNLQTFDIFLSSQIWFPEADGVSATGCADLALAEALPRIELSADSGGAARSIRFTIDEREREEISGGSTRERMQISTFVSAGELSQQFTLLEGPLPSEPRLSTVTWTPPAHALSADGELVRFWFVVRDGRGGLASTTRAVCMVP